MAEPFTDGRIWKEMVRLNHPMFKCKTMPSSSKNEQLTDRDIMIGNDCEAIEEGERESCYPKKQTSLTWNGGCWD